MSEENIQSEIENKYEKIDDNPETLKKILKLFPSQKDVKEKYLKNIEKGIFYFSSISGYWGSGKTFIAKNIGEELKNIITKDKKEELKNIDKDITCYKNKKNDIKKEIKKIENKINYEKEKINNNCYMMIFYRFWQIDLELIHIYISTELKECATKELEKKKEELKNIDKDITCYKNKKNDIKKEIKEEQKKYIVKITDKIKNVFINIILFLFCINKNEVKDKYITFHYGLWQTDLELMHKHFLTELAVSAGKKNDKQIELSIHYSRLLEKACILLFFLIILLIIFQVFNMSSPLFSYIYSFIGEQIKEIIEVFVSLCRSFNIFKYTKVNVNENTVFLIIRISISVLLSIAATRFIYKRTGGTLYGITSVFGIGTGDAKCSLSVSNFYDIFEKIIKDKNIFMIIDNIDRVSKKNIENALAFLDNIKTVVGSYNKNHKKNKVFVCVPMFKEKILEIVKYNLTANEEAKTNEKAKTNEEKKENDMIPMLYNSIDFIDSIYEKEREELYKKTDDAEFFIDKLFEEEYKIENTIKDVINTFLENMGVDEKNSKNMSKYFLYSYNPNLRILSRELNKNFYLIAFMDMSRDYQNNKDKLEYILSNFLEDNITEKDSTRNNNININAKIKALFYASENGHYKTVKLLIDNKADIEAKNNEGKTPLMFASENGHYETVKLLIENKADIEAKDSEGKTPLILASQNGYTKTVKLLIENKADIEAKDNSERTALFNAVRERLNIIKPSYKTRLYKSKLKNYLDIANLLVAKGADILITDKFSLTLLMLSSQLKEFNKISKKIIEKADMNYINKKDLSKYTALIFAVKASNFEIVKLLTEKGADIYAIDSAERNALIYSVEKDDREIIKYFMEEKNIDIEQKYKYWTLVDYALVYGNIEIIEYLLSKGGKLHYEDNSVTSLMLVSGSAKRKTVEYIIDYTKEKLGLDIKDYINYKNESKQTALQYADFSNLNMNKKESDRKEVVNLLKDYGAS